MSLLPYPHRGAINEEYEFLMNCYGIGYDAANGYMITNNIGKFDKASIREVKARFAALKAIARKRSPKHLRYIERIEKITLENITGNLSDKEALRLMKDETLKVGGKTDLIRKAESHINHVERIGKLGVPPPQQYRLKGNILDDFIYGGKKRKDIPPPNFGFGFKKGKDVQPITKYLFGNNKRGSKNSSRRGHK